MSEIIQIQITLDERERAALARLAQAQGRSVAEIVSDLVRHHLDEQHRHAKAHEVLNTLQEMHRQIIQRSGASEGDIMLAVREAHEHELKEKWRAAKTRNTDVDVTT